MKDYGFNTDATHGAIIYERGTEAHKSDVCTGHTPGLIVGTSEWGWVTEDNGRRICAALRYFSNTTTEAIEVLADLKGGRK